MLGLEKKSRYWNLDYSRCAIDVWKCSIMYSIQVFFGHDIFLYRTPVFATNDLQYFPQDNECIEMECYNN